MLDTIGTKALPAPGATVLALWLDGWLRGAAGADDVLAVLARVSPDTPTALREAAGTHPADVLLQRVRGCQADGAWPLLPRPGHPGGWPTGAGEPRPAVLLVGSAPHNDLDVASGAVPQARALLTARPDGWVLAHLADASTSRLVADALPARPATRRFAELLGEAAADLAALGLDRPARGAAPRRWSRATHALPTSFPAELASLLHRICAVLDAVELALVDEGAAVTAAEARARAHRLWQLHGDLTDLVTAVTVGHDLGRRFGP